MVINIHNLGLTVKSLVKEQGKITENVKIFVKKQEVKQNVISFLKKIKFQGRLNYVNRLYNSLPLDPKREEALKNLLVMYQKKGQKEVKIIHLRYFYMSLTWFLTLVLITAPIFPA